MQVNTTRISKSTKDTAKIAKDFIVEFFKIKSKQAFVVGLYGDLGTGKTTFVRNIAKILNVKRKVNSPTFVIMKKYPIKLKNYRFLFHIDAYRLKNAKEIETLGWEDIVSDPENLIFIEWPEKVLKVMPKKHHRILISHTEEGYRNFEIMISK
jgi:tRNA threonylcarbamoyladenosine biosynthesis protein TsaE